MDLLVGARNIPSPMSNLLASANSSDHAAMTKNQQVMDKIAMFMGKGTYHTANKEIQTERMVSKFTNIPEISKMTQHIGWSKAQALNWYKQVVMSVGGINNETQMSAWGQQAFANPASFGFTGAGEEDWNVGSDRAERDRKQGVRDWMVSNMQMMHPSAEFAQVMQMASVLPIARQMIPNTVWLKAIQTDSIVGQVSKMYALKNRFLAFQQGLTSQVAGLPPAPVQEYDPLLVTPEDFERPLRIDMKYIEIEDFDVAADILADGGREMQVLIDQTAFGVLDSVIPLGDLTSAPAGTNLGGFQVGNSGTVIMLDQNQPPQIEHLLAANQLLRDRGFNPDLLIISPFELGQLMSQQAILMAYAFGTREVQETGLVGTLVGDAVAWTPNLVSGGAHSSFTAWVCDSSELARTVLGWPISLYPKFEFRSLDYKLYCRLQILIRNANAAVRIQCNNFIPGVI